MANKPQWLLLSLGLQLVAAGVLLSGVWRRGIGSGDIGLLLLLGLSAAILWRARPRRRGVDEADVAALQTYVTQRLDGNHLPTPQFANPRLQPLVDAIARLGEPAAASGTTPPTVGDGRPVMHGQWLLPALSHELRTPINAILGALGLLGDAPLEAPQRELLNNAQRASQDLWRVVHDLMDYVQTENGELPISATRFDPTALVQKVVEHWNPLARERGIEIASVVDVRVPTRVEADAERLEQVLTHLLNNAIRRTGVGGVVLSLSSDAANTLSVTISDTGAEVSDGFRAAWAQDDVTQGGIDQDLGLRLGLALSRRLVARLGGELRFDDGAEQGNRFSFTLPVGHVTADAAAADWMRQGERLQGARCLLVEDNPSSLYATREQLRAWNVEVDTVPDGQHAVRRLQDAAHSDRPYDLAIVDLSLPDLGGVELANRIRAIKDFQTLTLVSMVGDRDDGASLRLQDQGFDAFLVKPVRQSSMAQWLGEAIRRQHNAEEVLAAAVETPAADTAVGGRLLLVEDSPANRIVASTMLTKAGYDVESAENGEEALQRAEAEDWDLILMDLQMPVMDGITSASRIRELSGSRGQVPIIAVTANVFPEDIQACADAGMAEVVAKPIRREELLAAVTRWVRPRVADSTLVDVSTLSGLIERLGESGTARVLRVFFEESMRRIDRIRDGDPAVRAGELAKLEQAANSFGARVLAKACGRVARHGETFEALEKGLSQARVAFRERVPMI